MRGTVKKIANVCVVYYFLIFLLCVIVLKSGANDIVNRIEQLISMLFLCIYPVYYFLILWANKKRKYKEMDYYDLQFPDVNSLKRANSTAFIYFYIYLAIALVILVIDWLFTYGEMVGIFLMEFHEDLWVNENFSAITGIVVSVYAFLFAFFPIIVSYLKDKCLFFEPFDLPIVNNSKKITIISMLVVVIYIMSVFGDASKFVLGACELIWMVIVVINVLIYIYIFVIPIKIEKRVIKKIYHLFPRKEIYVTPNKKWWKTSAIKQFSNLLKKYKKSLCQINIESIESIEFGCVCSKRKENVDLAHKRFLLLVGIGIVTMVLMGLFLPFSNDIQLRMIYLVVTMIALMPVLIPLLDNSIIVNSYDYINRMGYISTWGYYIKLTDKEQRLFVTSYDFSFSKYKKCLVELKRLVCFYNLAINMKYEDAESIDDIGIKCLCAYIKDLSYGNVYKEGMIIPVLICTCLCQNRKVEIAMTVKEMLSQLKLSNKEQTESINVSLQVLRNLHGNDFEFEKRDYKKELLELFE